MKKSTHILLALGLATALLLTAACGKDEVQEPSGPAGTMPEVSTPVVEPTLSEESLLLRDQLMVLDARLSNPYSAERKEDLLREYATVFETYLQHSETFDMAPDQLIGEGGYVLAAQTNSIGVDAGAVRLLEYGSPDEAVFFALQTREGDTVAARNLFQLYSSADTVANNSAACLFENGGLWMLLINEYKDGDTVWYNPVVFHGEDTASMAELPMSDEFSQVAEDYVLEAELIEAGIKLRFVDFESNEIGGCQLAVVDGEALFTSW